MEAVWQKLTCSTCGGQLEEKDGKRVCKYCRSVYHAIEKISEAEVIALNNATTDRNRMMFDDAQEKYDLLLKDYPDNAEANWGAFLCAYGIIYEKDYNGKYKPTCHRLNECPVKKSPYYAKLTDENKKRADEIETLRLKILDEVKKIQPYDVFICYKQNEDKASESAPKISTRESKWARDIYEMLSRDLGLKVFFAEKSLSGTNVDYEPHIYAALRSAKLMVVLASSIEHVNAVWVKNEWKRYAKYIREGENKTLRVVYDGIEPYELPKELQNKQAICHDDMNWNEALANSVRELFNAAPELARKEYKEITYTRKEVEHGQVDKRELPVFEKTSVPASEETNLKTIESLMGLKKFKPAVANLRVVLAANRACSRGYLDLFLCENECANAEAFINGTKAVASFTNYENALASAETEKEKEEILDILVSRIHNKPTLALLEEFAHLPNATQGQTRRVMLSVYDKAKESCDCALFDALLKIITDTDQFIEWNFEFAKCLHLAKKSQIAKKYIDTVLNLDEGHQESLLYKYMIQIGARDENAFFLHCYDKLKDYKEIEKIYEYGYFSRLSSLLFEKCFERIEKGGSVENGTRLADFLLSIIPQGENSRYLNNCDKLITALFKVQAYKYINKYLEQVLVISPNNDEAYFQKVMVKYKVNNPFSLVKATDKLMDEEDYINALNTYARNYPTKENLYMQLYSQYDYIQSLLKEYKLTANEFAQDWILQLSIQELADESIRGDFSNGSNVSSKNKLVSGFSGFFLVLVGLLVVGSLAIIIAPMQIFRWVEENLITTIFVPLFVIVAISIVLSLCFINAGATKPSAQTKIAANHKVTATIMGLIASIVFFLMGLGNWDGFFYEDNEKLGVRIYEFDGHYYCVYSEALTWEEAELSCETKGGHLVTVNSQEENFFLYDLIGKMNYDTSDYSAYHFYIGGINSENGWHWITNEPFEYKSWYEDEPSGNGIYATIWLYRENRWGEVYKNYDYWGNGKSSCLWDDCDGSYYYICEWESKGVIGERAYYYYTENA